MRITKTAAAAALTAALGVGGAALGATGATAAPAATPIHFAPGATSDSVSGVVAQHGDREYTFSARAGQEALVQFTSKDPSVFSTLIGPNGEPLHNSMSEEQTAYSATLPASGTYHLDVRDDASSAGRYTMRLILPIQIRFARGATSSAVSGSLRAGGSRDYSFDARAGQRATVVFDDASSTARWVLVAPGGIPLHGEMSADQHSATVTLPSTGTYNLQVRTGVASSYGLHLHIPAR